jgi:hypothetical protein
MRREGKNGQRAHRSRADATAPELDAEPIPNLGGDSFNVGVKRVPGAPGDVAVDFDR